MPRVSIGVPVYNGAATLERAIDSLLAQDFGDFEILISDNASTDDTPAICAAYVARDPRVRYRRNETNLGAAANYNLLVDWAQGEYFRWAAHDDMCSPTHLSRCLEAYRNGPKGAVLAYPWTRIIDADDRELELMKDEVQTTDGRAHRRLAQMLSRLGLCNAVMGLMRTEALRETRRIASFRSSDVLLLSELAMLGEILQVPDYLFWRRRDLKTCGIARLSADEQAAWFDPRVKRASPFIRTRLFLEHFRSTRDLPLAWGERMLCAWTVLRIWGVRYWRVMGGELKIALRRKLGMGPPARRPAPTPNDP